MFQRAFLLGITLLPCSLRAQTPVASAPTVWKQARVTPGGFVAGIVIAPLAPSRKYVRTDVGGAFAWNARTQEWAPLSDNLLRDGYGCESLAVDARGDTLFYAGAGAGADGGEVFQSRDQGASWTPLRLRKPDGSKVFMGSNDPWRNAGERLAVDPNNARILYFASRKDGLWRTLDGGQTWAAVPSVAPGVSGAGQSFVVFDARSKKGGASATVYVGVTGAGVLRSLDGGRSWSHLKGPGAGFYPMRAALAGNGALFVSFQKGDKWDGPTGGALWRFQGDEAQDVSPAQAAFCGVSVDARNPQSLVAASWPFATLYRSLDGGVRWKPITPTFEQPAFYPSWYAQNWIADVAIDPENPAQTWFANGTGVYRTRDNTGEAQTFALDGNGIEELCTLGVRKVPGGPLLWSVSDLVGFSLSNLDKTPSAKWEAGQQGHATGVDFCASSPGNIARVGGTYGDAQFDRTSSDGGNTWQPMNAPSGKRWGSIALSGGQPKNLVWLPADWTTPYYSLDGGASWTQSNGPDGTPQTAPTQLWHNSPYSTSAPLVADPKKSGVFYLYGKDGSFWRSEDGGARWAPVCPAQSAQLPDWWQYALKAAPDASGELWMNFVGSGKGNGLYRSLDGGAHWTKMTALSSCLAFGFGRAAPGQTRPCLFVYGTLGGKLGVYRGDDSLTRGEGAHWQRVDSDNRVLPLPPPAGLDGDPDRFGWVYLGTTSRGLFYGVPSR